MAWRRSRPPAPPEAGRRTRAAGLRRPCLRGSEERAGRLVTDRRRASAGIAALPTSTSGTVRATIVGGGTSAVLFAGAAGSAFAALTWARSTGLELGRGPAWRWESSWSSQASWPRSGVDSGDVVGFGVGVDGERAAADRLPVPASRRGASPSAPDRPWAYGAGSTGAGSAVVGGAVVVSTTAGTSRP